MSYYEKLLAITTQAKHDIKAEMLADSYQEMLEDVYGESITEALIALRKANAEVAEFLDERLEQRYMDLVDDLAEDLAIDRLQDTLESIIRTL